VRRKWLAGGMIFAVYTRLQKTYSNTNGNTFALPWTASGW